MSLILVATVGGVLLERFSSVARRTDAWGYAGAEPGTRPATVRGPPTAVFSRPSCQITVGQFMARVTTERLTTEQGLLHHIELWVPDLARAERSWGWLLTALGAELFQEWLGGPARRKGSPYRKDPPLPPPRKLGAGTRGGARPPPPDTRTPPRPGPRAP